MTPDDAASRPEEWGYPDLYFMSLPGEGCEVRESRWNRVIGNYHRAGLTAIGTGPDWDWPVRVELVDESKPFGPFYEIYNVVTLEERARLTADDDNFGEVG